MMELISAAKDLTFGSCYQVGDSNLIEIVINARW